MTDGQGTRSAAGIDCRRRIGGLVAVVLTSAMLLVPTNSARAAAGRSDGGLTRAARGEPKRTQRTPQEAIAKRATPARRLFVRISGRSATARDAGRAATHARRTGGRLA